ncbi:precorrin-3B C(17)-methyltransferase [Fusibacter bizertensis]
MINIVGIGPGSQSLMTQAAIEAIDKSEVIVGYKTYVDLIKPMLVDQEVISNGMRGEVARCTEAVKIAKTGKRVAVISSGDAGVYGMAGLIYELAETGAEINVIPGVTASTAGAALLGAPLMHDFCHISLSDLMTPIDQIMKRVKAAAETDFVICLYNPKSHGRPDYISQALSIIKEVQGSSILVGIAKNIGRLNESTHVFLIDEVNEALIDMTSVVIVGNRGTKLIGEKMVTPRGYQV